MTITSTTAAQRVRAQVDHPIIDGDGHFVEIPGVFDDELASYKHRGCRRPGAARAVPGSTARRWRPERDGWRARRNWWGQATSNSRTGPPPTCRP